MAEIELTKGKIALVDDADAVWLEQTLWTFTEQGYAVRMFHQKREYMHRVILNAKSGETVDHINRDKLDNRRVNLRLVTVSQNSVNSKDRPRRSGVRNIYESGEGWEVDIKRRPRRWRKWFKTMAEALKYKDLILNSQPV